MQPRTQAPWLVTLLSLLCLAAFASVLPITLAQEKSNRMLRHVVLFKFKETSSKEDVQEVVDAFRSLKKSIPEVAAFEHGTDNSPEGLANGFTHCFLVTFKSEKDRDAYLPHPKHKEFVEVLKPHLDKVQVIDYWAQD
ncbi:Dabb family protein [Pirellulaceae bacterium SH467]